MILIIIIIIIIIRIMVKKTIALIMVVIIIIIIIIIIISSRASPVGLTVLVLKGLGWGRVDVQGAGCTLRVYRGLGFRVDITPLHIGLQPLAATFLEGFKKQAYVYGSVLGLACRASRFSSLGFVGVGLGNDRFGGTCKHLPGVF